MNDLIETGLYRHYKGHEYFVLGTDRHSETQELLVVYRAKYAERGLWGRPFSMFQEVIKTSNGHQKRFQKI